MNKLIKAFSLTEKKRCILWYKKRFPNSNRKDYQKFFNAITKK